MTGVRRFALVALLLAVRLAAAEPVDVLLVAADDALLQPVLARLAHAQSTTRGAWTCWTGQLSGQRVALTRAEGDPLNAVAATTLAIRQHPPRLVLVFSAGRPVAPGVQAGDVVVSEKFAAFDGFVSPVTGRDGGSDPLTWKKLPHLLMTPGEKEVPAETFPADAPAAAIALRVKPARGRVLAGVIGSANQINGEADRLRWLHQTWGVSAADRVSAHVAGCARLLAVPVVGVCVVDGSVADVTGFTLQLLEALR
jgi:adenosylhomocysteine nucleosidase